MIYDFDKINNRKNTNSLKFDFAVERGKPENILPLWVADMDFEAPREVIDALKEKAEHGIFGYTEPKPDYFEAVAGWFRKRHGWNPDPKKFVLSPGVVFSICALIRALTKEGDAVLICQPVYYPFEESIKSNNRKLVVSELVHTNGFYTVDYADFERKIVENDVKAFILCNPHNPVGRVWTEEELEKIGDICLRHNVFVISDEIHCDFTYGKNKHTVFQTVRKELEQICAVCTAPTKTFNLAGLHIANTYIENDDVRSKYARELDRQGYSQPNVMGMVACQAAYSHGGKWLDRLLPYLEENIRLVQKYADGIPGVSLIKPQGTYLVWLDCRKTGLSAAELSKLIVNKAGVWLDDGYIFGQGGDGFERINVACPRAVLTEALERLKKALV